MNSHWRVSVALGFLIIGTAGLRGAEKPVLTLDPGGHVSSMRGLAFTPDGNELISVSSQPDFIVRFWNVKSGELMRVLHLPAYSNVGATALSPDGKLLALSLSNEQKEWGIALIPVHNTSAMRHVLTGHTGYITSLAFSPGGTRLVSASGDKTVRVWDAVTMKHLHTLSGHDGLVENVAFSPDGSHLATCSRDRSARIWDVLSGKELALLVDPNFRTGDWNGLAWSPDGKTIVNGCYGRAMRVWNTDGSLRERITTVLPYRSIAFSKDSRFVLFAALGGGYYFDLERKETVAVCNEIEGEVWRVALSPDNRVAAMGGAKGEDLLLWDTANGKVLHRLAGAGRTPIGAAWSPDGKSIAWGIKSGGQVDWGNGGPLRLKHPIERSFDLTELEFGPAPGADWLRNETATGNLSVETAYYDGFTGGWVNVKEGGRTIKTIEQNWSVGFTFLPGERLVLGGGFAGLRMHDARTGQLLRKFQGSDTRSIAVSHDNRFLLATQGDQTLRVWALDREDPLLSLFVAGNEWIAWTPEGYYAASPGGEKLMGWQINNGPGRLASFYPAAQFRKTLYRPDVLKQLLKAGSVEKALQMTDAARGKTTPREAIDTVLPPLVRLMSPDKSRVVQEATLEVRARATSVGRHPVTSMQLLMDGRPLPVQGGLFRIEAPKLGDVETSWHITLTPGEHRLSVRADSAVSGALSEDIVVNYVAPDPAEQLRLPSLYVLPIGISEYPGNLKLNYAAKDAQVLAQTLQQFSKPLFEKIVVKELLDKKATRTEILKEITLLKKMTTQRDCAIVFFAGHGDMSSDGGLYLLPADVDPENLEATGIASEQVRNLLTAFPSKVIFMLDACHSGGIDSGKKRNTKPLTDDLIRDLVTDERGVIALCASTGRQFALESNEHRHGLFTLAIIEGLKGKATKTAEGAVYLHHLDAYVTDRVKELSQGRQSPTTARPASIRSFPLSKP